jgi:hypothetical protein
MKFEIPEDSTEENLVAIAHANEAGLELVALTASQAMQNSMRKAPNIIAGEGGWKRPQHSNAIRSQPGEAPYQQSGALWRSITYGKGDERGQWIAGTEAGYHPKGTPYGYFLDRGTEKMQPRPWLGATVEKIKDRLRKEYEAGFMHAMKWRDK